MSGGRPSKYDPSYCEALIAHLSEGASIASFAAEINVARSTINKWAEDNPEFSEALKVAKAKCAAWWEARLREIAKQGGGPGASTAVIFGLKNMASEDWRDKQEHELTGKDGGAIKTDSRLAIDPTKLSPSAMEEILNAAPDGE